MMMDVVLENVHDNSISTIDAEDLSYTSNVSFSLDSTMGTTISVSSSWVPVMTSARLGVQLARQLV